MKTDPPPSGLQRGLELLIDAEWTPEQAYASDVSGQPAASLLRRHVFWPFRVVQGEQQHAQLSRLVRLDAGLTPGAKKR